MRSRRAGSRHQPRLFKAMADADTFDGVRACGAACWCLWSAIATSRGPRDSFQLAGPGLKARRSVAVPRIPQSFREPGQSMAVHVSRRNAKHRASRGRKARDCLRAGIAHTKLDLACAGTFSKDTLARMRKHMGSDLVVLGSYTVLGADLEVRASALTSMSRNSSAGDGCDRLRNRR